MSTKREEAARRRVLANVADLGLNENLLELETQGFTVLKQALTPDQVERAKSAILERVQRQTGSAVDPEKACADDYRGMHYQHYLIFEDPVFQEILLQERSLALMHYLLGESCVLSSMGSHFRGPGGLPLAIHADGSSVGMTETSLVANCNYALTPYSAENGALVLVPGSHRRNRPPTARENWRSGERSIFDVMKAQPSAEELDAMTWTPPSGAVTMDIAVGDAVIWHGNTWHGGWRRDALGTRINLAAYFCRSHIATQERRGDDRYPEVFRRYNDDPRFAQLMGERVFNGWREEGPDFTDAKSNPVGIFD
jgi:ectoine hydroxylase-related dioxygenase (phytanoyl-CoA dioxygenase family)